MLAMARKSTKQFSVKKKTKGSERFDPAHPAPGNIVYRVRRGDGYVHAVTATGRRGLEHRFVMEEMIGRELRKGETVHHKNGVCYDNRPENLELHINNHAQGSTVAEMLAWAYEIIETYGPLAKS